MGVVLYSTNCPKCNVLSMKLKDKNVDFTVNTNVDDMIAKGFQSAPILEVNGEYYEFGDAVRVVNNM